MLPPFTIASANLNLLHTGEGGIIQSLDSLSPSHRSELWALGILPGKHLQVVKCYPAFTVVVEGMSIILPRHFLPLVRIRTYDSRIRHPPQSIPIITSEDLMTA